LAASAHFTSPGRTVQYTSAAHSSIARATIWYTAAVLKVSTGFAIHHALAVYQGQPIATARNTLVTAKDLIIVANTLAAVTIKTLAFVAHGNAVALV
jgi:hypothetical protein